MLSLSLMAAFAVAQTTVPAAGFSLEPRQGDMVILPFGEGMAYPVDADIPLQASLLRFSSGMELSMGFFGRLRDGEWTMFGVPDTLDAGLSFSRTNGLLRVAYEGPTNKELHVFHAKTLGAAAAAYRQWRESLGRVRTLVEKSRTNPLLRDFPGTADVWLWDDNTQSRLYNWPIKEKSSPRDTRRIAGEMKSLGMDRVLWNSFEGETADSCAYLKSIGYHVGTYECMRDVFHKGLLGVADPKDFFRAARFLPIADDITRVNADGAFAKAWSIPDKSGRMHPMHALCDALGLEMCRRFIAPEVARVGYDSRLMDVQAGGGPACCFAKAHPCTKHEALEALRREHRYMCDDLRQITGVEVGGELLVDSFHYSEGLTSCPHQFRKELCWRYKDRALYGSDVPEATRNILHNPRYRIPLWELVYHDCTVSYYYWADSTLMYPELTRTKDLFCALYGLPPIYSMNVSTWNRLKHEVAASYSRATPVARRTMFSQMTDYEVLTSDRLVQRTRFANGVCVTANFSARDFVLEDGEVVRPQEFIVQMARRDEISFETASGLTVTGRIAYPDADWNGRLWIVDGATSDVCEALLDAGAAVAWRTTQLVPGEKPTPARWRDVGYRAMHGFVETARRRVVEHMGGDVRMTYFLGVGAAGGCAALHEAQQFPDDIDGVVSLDADCAPAAGRVEAPYLNAANPDFHAFRRRGGKLVLRATRGSSAFARLSAYRDRIWETEGSALRAGRFFAFSGIGSISAAEQLAAVGTIVAWCEKDVLPSENAGFDDTPVAATLTADRYDHVTHTLAQAQAADCASQDPFDFIRSELCRGVRNIRVPTARYEVDPKARTDSGQFVYLRLRGLDGISIDFGRSEIIGKVRTRILDCVGCTNLTIRNLSVDFCDLPFTQGVITKVDADRNWDVKILQGYPIEDLTGQKGESASHDDFWPLQAYDSMTLDWVNPMRFQAGVKIVRTGADTFRVTGGENRAGSVGDIAVWSLRDRKNRTVDETFIFHHSPGLRCENITLFATPHGRAFYEFYGNASLFSGCRIVRRPPETDLARRAMRRLRSGNHDGIISKACPQGPRIEDCQFTYHCDDCVNISGQYSVFSSKAGRRWRILDNWFGIKPKIGSRLQILTFDGRTLTNEVTVLNNVDAGPVTEEERTFMSEKAGIVFGHGKSVRHASELLVDSDVDPGRYAAIVSEDSLGNGFVITNCVFGYSRARGLLLKASHGEVRDNLIVRTSGPGLSITTEYSWLSGGCANDINVSGNVFWRAGRWQVDVGGDVGVNRPVRAELQAGAHSNLRIVSNRLLGARGIHLVGCVDTTVQDNLMQIESEKQGTGLYLQRSARILTDMPFVDE